MMRLWSMMRLWFMPVAFYPKDILLHASACFIHKNQAWAASLCKRFQNSLILIAGMSWSFCFLILALFLGSQFFIYNAQTTLKQFCCVRVCASCEIFQACNIPYTGRWSIFHRPRSLSAELPFYGENHSRGQDLCCPGKSPDEIYNGKGISFIQFAQNYLTIFRTHSLFLAIPKIFTFDYWVVVY